MMNEKENSAETLEENELLPIQTADAEQNQQTEETDDSEIVEPPKRGRGRPPKNASQDAPKEEEPEDGADAAEAEELPSGRGDAGDVSLMFHGMRVLGEIVRSQNQAQQQLIKTQAELSNSMMDRLDNYRMECTRIQSESAEKEKSRLHADILSAQDRAEELSEENHQLRNQLEAAGKRIVKMTAKIESLETENASLRGNSQASNSQSGNTPVGGRVSGSASSHGRADASSGCATPEWLMTRKERREKKKRDRFLSAVGRNPHFSGEQIEVIRQAASAAIPLDGLKKICRPDISVQDMRQILQQITGGR